MRLAEEKIKQGIWHTESYVRDVALSYFTAAFCEDRDVMPIATEAMDRFGWDNAFSDLSELQALPQSDESITWIVDEIEKIGNPANSSELDYVTSLCWIAAEAEASLLKRRRQEFEGLGFFNAEAREVIGQRTRLLSASPRSCWEEFEQCCVQLGAGPKAKPDSLAKAYQLLEVIARNPGPFAAPLLSALTDEVDPTQQLARAWMRVCAIRGVGAMRLKEAITPLVEILQGSQESWVYEDCVVALAQIGGDEVIKAVWNACAVAPEHFTQYAAWILESVRQDLSVESALHLLQQAEDLDSQIGYSHSLLANFAVDGIAPVRHLVLNHADVEDIVDLRRDLTAVCSLMEAEFPELDEWRQEFQSRKDASERWRIPEFPVEDTWSTQIVNHQSTDPTAPQRLPLSLPKKPRVKGVGRNQPCPCKSGKKYKNCCLQR